MFEQALSNDTKLDLEILKKETFLAPFYLAGGTALAFQLGHRLSFDLDFFTLENFDHLEIKTALKTLGSLEIESEVKNTLVGKFNRTKISFFTYPYKLISPTINYSTIKIAGIKDISSMKLDALSSRGLKRDFIDLFFICKNFLLQDVFIAFENKFSGINYSLPHILKSLTYFEDAEKDEMPQMLIKTDWEDVKSYFIKEAKEIAGCF